MYINSKLNLYTTLITKILFPSIYMFPLAFYQAGLFFSIISLLIIGVISVISYTLVIESLAIHNSLISHKDLIKTILDNRQFKNIKDTYSVKMSNNNKDINKQKFSENDIKILNNKKNNTNPLFNIMHLNNQDISNNNNNIKSNNSVENELDIYKEKEIDSFIIDSIIMKNENISEGNLKKYLLEDEYYEDVDIIEGNYNILPEEKQDYFFIYKKIDLYDMIDFICNKKEAFICKFLLLVYFSLIIGITSSFCTNSLINILNKNIYGRYSEGYGRLSQVFIILMYLFTSSIISLLKTKTLHKISKMFNYIQFFILIIIFSIMSSNYNLINNTTYTYSINKFKIKNFNTIIGTSLYALLITPFLPSYIEKYTPQKSLFKVLLSSVLSALLIIIIFSILSLYNFSNILTCDINEYPCAIQSNFSINFTYYYFIGEIVTYSQLLNIINTAIVISYIKNINFINNVIFRPTVYQNLLIKIKNFAISLFVLVPAITIGIFINDIVTINYIVVFVGCIVQIYIPYSLLAKYRGKINSCEVRSGKLNISLFNKKFLNLIVLIVIFPSLIITIFISCFYVQNKVCVTEVDYMNLIKKYHK